MQSFQGLFSLSILLVTISQFGPYTLTHVLETNVLLFNCKFVNFLYHVLWSSKVATLNKT